MRNRMRTVNTLLVGGAVLVAAANCQAEIKIEEKIVGPAFTPGVVYTLSPKGMHVATVHGRDGKTLVTVDGVEGPLIDKIFDSAAFGIVEKISEDGYYTRTELKWTGPVKFSPNGERHAYAGQIGQEVVVILDGKEIFRGPASQSGPAVEYLQFSPDSKHLFFHNRTSDSYQSYRLLLDGQPVTPAFEGAQMPFFSKDGSRWGLLAGKPKMPNQKFLIIDGKDAGYVGEQPQFTPDGKHLVCIAGQMAKFSLLVDGKEMVSGQGIDKFVISPTGDIGAIVIPGSDGRKKLFLNGKPTADDAADVVFSPDGKHMAAICGLNQKAWVILDGQKHKEFWPIQNVAFTPDSSKCVYVAGIGEKSYVVVNGKENDEGNVLLHYRPIYSVTGNSIIYEAGFMMKRLSVHYNDHVESQSLANFNLTLSPDGQHYLYYRSDPDNLVRLIEDGTMNAPPSMQMGGPIFFSPDSKHFVAPLFQSFWCDGQKIVSPNTPIGFTPDSQHLILKGRDSTPDGITLNTYYVNGDLVAKFSARGSTWSGYGIPKAWEQQPNGTIVFVGAVTGVERGYGPVKRITVTPDPARHYVAWLADVKTGEAKAAADAEAAKVKAAEDAVTAKKKAEEDAVAAAAKKKADYEAAVAAKNKARQDALKAKQLYLLNAQRAKKGLPPLTELPDK
jgi:hypothetical protein